ncbi:MAG TPA: winged helix-turn-helix transcriptional regulator [Candidatus Thermoplasmatota archaeon]|nr:winged helix-turn-helix transcriptional regulator [Candidatus Thermoplasmatota archaeon]
MRLHAMLAFAVVAGAALASLPAASASADGMQRLAGDEGEYVLRAGGDEQRIRFLWHGPREVPGAQGPVLAEWVQLERSHPDPNASRAIPGGAYVAAGGTSVVASSDWGRRFAAYFSNAVEESVREAAAVRYRFDGMGLPCGLVNGFQDASGGWLGGDCGGGSVGMAVARAGPGMVGDIAAEAWASADGALTAWFAPGVPYPLYVERGPAVASEGPDPAWTLHLVAFQRGTGTLDEDQAAAAVGQPPQQFPAADGDERGMPPLGDHPYPLLHALAEAAKEEAWYAAPTEVHLPHKDVDDWRVLTEFLRDHPEWKVLSAAYSEFAEAGARQFGWRFILWGPGEVLAGEVGHQYWDLAVVPGVAMPKEANYDQFIFQVKRERAPDLQWVGGRVPDVGAMELLWQQASVRPGHHVGFRAAHCDSVCRPALAWTGDVDTFAWSTYPLQARVVGREQATEDTWSWLAEGEGGSAGFLQGTSDFARSFGSPSLLATREPVPGAAATVPAAPSLPPVLWAGLAATGAVVGLGLLAWKFLPLALFSRLHRGRVLEHPARERLVRLVQEHPGIHFNEVVRRSGHGKGTVEHHLRVLEDAGLVVAKRHGGYTCYFRPAAGARTAAPAVALKSAGARRIVDVLGRDPGLGVRGIARATGLSPATVHRHLRRLASAGLVRLEGPAHARRVLLVAGPEAASGAALPAMAPAAAAAGATAA